MKKTILYFDMDDVLADFRSGLKAFPQRIVDEHLKQKNPDEIPGLFAQMKPMEGAVETVEKLAASGKYEMFILSTAPWNNPSAWCDKLEWVKRTFDHIHRYDEEKKKEVPLFYKRIILSHRKDLCLQPGAYLIDDRSANGADAFGDHLLRLTLPGTHQYEINRGEYTSWEQVLQVLL